MKQIFGYCLFAITLIIAGCSDPFDDSKIWDKLDDHESRIVKLEELCKQMNTNISSLQTIVTALQNNDYVTGVAPVTKNGETIGYTITFTKSQPITIYHGENGKDGQNGTNGVDGKDGSTPVIGVKMDDDGVYYWTLNGEWLTDENGNKIKAVGTDGADGKDGQNGTNGTDGQNGTNGADGKDGITPQLKIENGYWYVSYDNGATWTQLGKAIDTDNSVNYSIFKNVTYDDEYVYFTLIDDTIITVPKAVELDIEFDVNGLIVASPNSTICVDYTITSTIENVTVEITSSADIKAKVDTDDASGLSGTIEIKTGATIDEYSKVIVFVSNGEKVIMRSITFEKACLVVEEDATTKQVSADGGEVVLEFFSNVDCEVIIPNDAKSWISLASDETRALVSESVGLNIAKNNTGVQRSAVVKVVKKDDKSLSVKYTITQERNMDYVILYTTTNGKTIRPNSFSYISNTYEDGVGMLAFDGSKVTSIGESAFYECTSLTSITIPDSVTSIGIDAFYCCTSLTSITIPDSITSIGNNAFALCSSLTSITIPDSVTSIGNNAFSDCTSLTSITIPDSVTSIGDDAFAYCYSLTSVTIPDSVTSIGNFAFFGCYSLKSITISDSVTSIGNNAFSGCTSLKSIKIPDSVTSIGSYAFSDCTSLTSVYCKPTTPPTGGSNMFNNNVWLYVPRNSVDAYKSAPGWSNFASSIRGYDF